MSDGYTIMITSPDNDLVLRLVRGAITHDRRTRRLPRDYVLRLNPDRRDAFLRDHSSIDGGPTVAPLGSLAFQYGVVAIDPHPLLSPGVAILLARDAQEDE